MDVDRIPSNGEQSLWILNKLPSIPHFQQARPQVKCGKIEIVAINSGLESQESSPNAVI